MTFLGKFQRYLSDLGPYFLRNKHIGAFLDSTALIYDSAAQTLELGLRMGQPLNCDVSALPILRKDRGIRLYPSESEESQRQRLSDWLMLHRQRGTHQGEMRHSQGYFGDAAPIMRIVHQSGGASPIATWHTLRGDGSYEVYHRAASNWNWDGQTSHWSRFWVICYAPADYVSGITYGDGSHYGDGSFYGGAANPTIAADLVAMINDWKSAHSVLAGYIIATEPGSFNPALAPVTHAPGYTSLPNGNWGQPITAAGVRTRLPSALFVYDMRSTV